MSERSERLDARAAADAEATHWRRLGVAGIAALDVPAALVEQQLASDVLRKAMAATHSPSDRIAYAQDLYLVTHPKACSKNEDYPGFADWVARQQKKNEDARRAS